MLDDHGRFYEDFEIGDRFETAGRTITEGEIVSFVNLGGIHEELFTNLEYIKKESAFGGRVAPGLLTLAFAEGLFVQTGLIRKTAIALLSTSFKLLAPTRVNDTIHVQVEVTDKKTTSSPGRGIITFTHTVINQNGQAVMGYTPVRMIKRRE